MNPKAEKADLIKTTEKPTPISSDDIGNVSNDEQTKPIDDGSGSLDAIKTHTLNVMGKEIKISRVKLVIDGVENHPGTRIVFKEPYIEWLRYFYNGKHHNVLQDESRDKIISTVKSSTLPWQEDEKRNKAISDAFVLRGWKKKDIKLLFKVVETAYLNNNDLFSNYLPPQMGETQTTPLNDDSKEKSTKTISLTASDIISLIEWDIFKDDLKNKLFTVDGQPYLILPHCKGIFQKDDAGIPHYIEMDINNHTNKMFNLTEKESEPLRAELQRLCRERYGVTARNATLREAILSFQGDAIQHKKIGVRRIQLLEGTLYYDMMLTENNKLVKITKDGWEMIDFKGMVNPENDEFVFLRNSNQLPQVMPSDTPDIKPMYKYFTLEDDEKTKFMVQDVITMYKPDIQQPIRQHAGPTDAGKSFKTKVTISLVDPGIARDGHGISTTTPPAEMIRLAHAGYLLAYDNVSGITKDQNDTLARISTGVNQDTRALFTNDISFAYESFMRPVVINGISTTGTETDVLNRSALFEINLKHKDNIKKINKAFEEDKPHMIAAIFDILSKALQYQDEMEEIALPPAVRLRDYAHFGCAVSKAMGNDPEDFLNYYMSTFNERDIIAVENNPIWAPLLKYLEIHGEFKGTPQELLDVLQVMFTAIGKTPPFDFPMRPQDLGTEIKKIEKNFFSLGVIFENGTKDKRVFYTFKYEKFVPHETIKVQTN